MDFSLSEEQSMLVDSVSRFIDNDYDFETRQRNAARDEGFDPATWRQFADLGWAAVPFAEDDGGLGGGPIEVALLMQQFGRGLVVEPYLANIVLAGGALRQAGNAEQKSEWLGGLIDGSRHAAVAFAEPQSRFDIADVATSAAAVDGGFVINGSKSMVLNARNADVFVIPARTGGSRNDKSGITLFLVPADTAGIGIRDYATVDGHQAAELLLTDVQATATAVLGNIDGGFDTLRSIVDDATLAVCAEAVGIMSTMHEKTVEYSKNRVQFGVPIGSFQALQHRMADNLIACEQSYSLMLWAVMLKAAGADDTSRAISALKYQIGTAGRRVAQEAVQIHGGMGITWELDIAHYFKRFSAIETLFGNADFHLDRYVALSA
ncbi:MAG: acyl-CoA dehydrogenase family protein [Gammaproteobacteria bacterium]|nr:acyl-CoA dehydrogenase family protein [Gammaproteobacteria bacterium]